MNWYCLSFVIILCINISQSSIEDEVKKVIQDIQNGIPEPIQFSKVNISVPENKFISGFLDVSNIVASGLKAFDLKVSFLFGTLPDKFTFRLEKFVLDTDYLMHMPLLNLSFLTIFGQGKFHLSLTNLSMNGTVQINFTHILKDVKLSLDDAQFNITGFLNDPEFNEDLSETLTKSIPLTVSSPEFASLVEDVLDGIVASLLNKTKTFSTDSSEDMSNGKIDMEPLFFKDLLDSLRIWAEDFFRDFRNVPDENSTTLS